MTISIERIRCIATAPAGIRLVIVKVETSEPGLYGIGCATFTQRPLAVIEAVDTTIVVPPGWTARPNDKGHIIMEAQHGE